MEVRKWKVGDSARSYMHISPRLSAVFGAMSGDRNPVHFDSDRMLNTHFKGTIANGIQCLSCIGAAIVELFVTEDTMVIAIEQHNSFLKPVHIPSSIMAVVTVDEVLKNNTYWLQCFVYNSKSEDTPCISSRFRVRVLDA